MRLANKVALVTGGASGFGAGIAKLFASNGARVAVVDLNKEGAERIAAEIGDGALALRCDVSSRADVRADVQAAHDRFGRLDVVVNNAGTSHRNKPMLEVSEDEFDRVFAVNV